MVCLASLVLTVPSTPLGPQVITLLDLSSVEPSLRMLITNCPGAPPRAGAVGWLVHQSSSSGRLVSNTLRSPANH